MPRRALLTLIAAGALGLAWFAVSRPGPAPHAREDMSPSAAAPPRSVEPPLVAAKRSGDGGLARPASADTEQALMERLRRADAEDPSRALELAREGDRRFPHGAHAAERGAIISKSLARLGRLSEARGEAERVVHDYPDSPWALEVERHTGAHPRRNQ